MQDDILAKAVIVSAILSIIFGVIFGFSVWTSILGWIIAFYYAVVSLSEKNNESDRRA